MDVEKIEHELQKIRDNKIQNIVEVLTAAVYDERYYDVQIHQNARGVNHVIWFVRQVH